MLPLERLAAAVIVMVTAVLFFNANLNSQKKYLIEAPALSCFLEREVEVILKKPFLEERYRVEKGLNKDEFFDRVGVKRSPLPYKKSKREKIKRKRTIVVE